MPLAVAIAFVPPFHTESAATARPLVVTATFAVAASALASTINVPPA